MQEIKYISIDKLKTHPTNPRKVDERQMNILCESIKANKDYFETRPILYNKDFVIFAGNMRFLAAKKNGLTEVPASLLDISEERQREIMIRDNRSNGNWDFDMLGNNFDMAELMDWGFDEKELLGSSFDSKNEDEKEDEIPPTPVVSISKIGDVFELGKHRVLCGDCGDKILMESFMASRVADFILTDPPYEIGAKGCGLAGDRKYLKDITESKIDEGYNEESLFSLIGVFSNENMVVFSSKEQIKKYIDFAEKTNANWVLKTWNKTNPTPLVNNNYLPDTEYIFHIWKDRKLSGTYEDKRRYFISARPQRETIHPTAKPIELLVPNINTGSDYGNLILDPFLGSGSTLIACEKTGRQCFGVEISPQYIDLVVSRWCTYTNTKRVKKNGEEIEWLTVDKSIV